MPLLADLALRIGKLRAETTASEALGAILARPEAAASLASAVRAGAPALPSPLEFSTQVADPTGRPDLVARTAGREVLHVECKFWFGFTEAQSNGAYLERLVAQHASHDPSHSHVGAVLFVVPPRRVAEVEAKVYGYYKLATLPKVGDWRFGKSPAGVVVAVASWQQALELIGSAGDADLAADCRQLTGLVDVIDRDAFVPWTEEQVTDLGTPQRIHQLAAMVDAAADVAVNNGVAAHPGGRRRTKLHVLAYGRFLSLGGVPAVLQVSTYMWATQGRSPIWLRFKANSDLARSAFGAEAVQTDDWVSVAVPLPTDRLEPEVLDGLVSWLAAAAERLAEAKAKTLLPVVDETVLDEGSD